MRILFISASITSELYLLRTNQRNVHVRPSHGPEFLLFCVSIKRREQSNLKFDFRARFQNMFHPRGPIFRFVQYDGNTLNTERMKLSTIVYLENIF